MKFGYHLVCSRYKAILSKLNSLFRIFRWRIWGITRRCTPTSWNNQDSETRRPRLFDTVWSASEETGGCWVTSIRSGVVRVVLLHTTVWGRVRWITNLVKWFEWELVIDSISLPLFLKLIFLPPSKMFQPLLPSLYITSPFFLIFRAFLPSLINRSSPKLNYLVDLSLNGSNLHYGSLTFNQTILLWWNYM